jgi:hypothetical protein
MRIANCEELTIQDESEILDTLCASSDSSMTQRQLALEWLCQQNYSEVEIIVSFL